MIVKTKHYTLEKRKYRKLAMRNVLLQQWWVTIIAVAICTGYLWIPSIWWFIGAAISFLVYLLFWWIQFYGITQVEQGKMLFERLSYEISSQQLLIKLNTREGMPVKWNQIKRAHIGKDYFVLMMSKVQLILLPFRIFNSENERKFLKSLLKSKNIPS